VEIVSRHVELSQAAFDEITLPCTRFPSTQSLHEALSSAGFVEVWTEPSVNAREAPTAAEYWDTFVASSPSLLALLDGLPEAKRQAIRQDAIATLGAMFPEGPVRLGGEVCLAAATTL
jgi:hypothetical protein